MAPGLGIPHAGRDPDRIVTEQDSDLCVVVGGTTLDRLALSEAA